MKDPLMPTKSVAQDLNSVEKEDATNEIPHGYVQEGPNANKTYEELQAHADTMREPTMPRDLPLNPGIANTVKFLNSNGFETTDSGDGRTHDCECDREYAYVVIRVKPEALVSEAKRLADLLRASGVDVNPIGPDVGEPAIQANYDPCDNSAFIEVTGVVDEDFTQGVFPSTGGG